MLIEREFEAGQEGIGTGRHRDVRQSRPHEPQFIRLTLFQAAAPGCRPASLNDPPDRPCVALSATLRSRPSLRWRTSLWSCANLRSCAGKPAPDAGQRRGGAVTIGGLADAGKLEEHEVSLDNQPATFVARRAGLDRFGQRLGQVPTGFKSTLVSAEPFDKPSESRHTVGCGACGGQRRGRLPLGKRIEFSPQWRFRLREQLGEPPLNPACRSDGQVRLDAVDNQTVPGQAVGGDKRLDRLSILEGRPRCGCVGLCQQLLHGLPGLRQIA